jgi:hypothetical protein
MGCAENHALTPSPLPVAATVPTTSQLVTTTPSPTLVGDWKVLASSDTVGALWSPDGKWMAVSDNVTNGPPDEQHLRLLDSTGDMVRALDGNDAIWLSATQFILSRGDSSFLGSVDSTVLTPTDAGSMVGGLSNDHGAIALTTIPSDQAKISFRIWTQGGTSSSMPGAAMAWSLDGTKLAVWHYTTPGHGVGGQPLGWLAVLSWPDLKPVATVKDASFAWQQQMSFDPTGRYLAATDGPNSVLDVATGRMVGPAGVQMTPAWDAAGDLVVPASDMSGHVTFYPVSGGPSTTLADVGDSAVSSTDGSTVVLYFSSNTDYRPITLIRNGVSRTIAVPGPVLYAPWLSANGSGAVVGCQVGGQLEALLLVG